MFSLAVSVVFAACTLCAFACAIGGLSLVALDAFYDTGRKTRRGLHLLELSLSERDTGKTSYAWEQTHEALRKTYQRLKALPVVRILVRAIMSFATRSREEALRDKCLFDLPEMVDILSLALGAGLSFDQAFEWYLDSFDTPLSLEFRQAEQAYQVGMVSRIRAFEDVAHRLQEESILRFVATLRQAFSLGSPLAPALDSLAFETRRYRKSRLEERIAKTPVKLLLPLGSCIVPAVLILLMGPIMTQVISGLSL